MLIKGTTCPDQIELQTRKGAAITLTDFLNMIFVLNDYLFDFWLSFCFCWGFFFNLMAVASQFIIIFKHRQKDKFNQGVAA